MIDMTKPRTAAVVAVVVVAVACDCCCCCVRCSGVGTAEWLVLPKVQ